MRRSGSRSGAEINGLAPDRREAAEEPDLVGVGRSVEVADENGGKTCDRRELRDDLRDAQHLRLPDDPFVEPPIEMRHEEGDLAVRRIDLGEDERALLVAPQSR